MLTDAGINRFNYFFTTCGSSFILNEDNGHGRTVDVQVITCTTIRCGRYTRRGGQTFANHRISQSTHTRLAGRIVDRCSNRYRASAKVTTGSQNA